jgi:hypothetical protein
VWARCCWPRCNKNTWPTRDEADNKSPGNQLWI